MAFIELNDVYKIYKTGDVEIHAADGISFEIERGEFVVIVGPSGAGKTTVLNILGGMDTSDRGKVMVDGEDIAAYDKRRLTKYRREDVGFVFQFYNLVQNLTALENVELATEVTRERKHKNTSCYIDPRIDVSGEGVSIKKMTPLEVLESVGLNERRNNFPGQLSGGEQQRVSIARALAKAPKLLLCDEPTGALDYLTGKAILGLLRDTCKKTGTTVIVITHNKAITPMADRVIRIKNGKTQEMYTNSNPVPLEEIEW